MFQPFRFSFWWRIALLGLVTGEISGGGGHMQGGFPGGGSGGGHPVAHPFPAGMGWFTPAHILGIAIGVVLFFVVIGLIFAYISSILRFVLLDAVLHGTVRIREGWRKWRAAGRQFFVWNLAMLLIGWMIVVGCLLMPLYLLYTGHHLGFWFIDATAIATLAAGFLALIVLSLLLAIAAVLAKDFVVPVMAFDGVGWQEGWRRFLAIARGHASEYVIYFLMKIVMRIVAGLVQGAIFLIVALIIALPVVIVVLVGVAAGAGATVAVKAMLITMGIVAGMIVIAVMVAVAALIGAPVAYFFVSYAVYFFAGRYEGLRRVVFPVAAPI